MKLKSLPFAALVLSAIGITQLAQAVTVDGVRTAGEYTGATFENQDTVSNWANGGHEALANLHAIQDGGDLAIHMGARIQDRGIILFIDSRTGGHNFIPNNLINFGGEENYINSLGATGSSGMTFESGFTADYAIRIYGDGATGAFVNVYDLNARVRDYAGNAGPSAVSKGVISSIRADGLGTTAIANNITAYAAAANGVEMKLNLAALGVPSGSQSVKLMAILVLNNSTYGSNQVLDSKTSDTNDIGNNINTFNFQSETGTQSITVPVNGLPSRPVEFSVNMNQEIAKGFFNPANHRAKVLFFTGLASPTPGEIYLTDANADGIYNGTLMATGAENAAFGTYKFFNTNGTANGGFEYGNDRTVNLGLFNTTQPLPTELFRSSYGAWAETYSSSQPASGDQDGDGVPNGVEFFMGSNNSLFTANPGPVSGAIIWPRASTDPGISFKVEVSSDLSVWQNAALAYPAFLDTSNPAQVTFTLPPGQGKIFSRLSVKP